MSFRSGAMSWGFLDIEFRRSSSEVNISPWAEHPAVSAGLHMRGMRFVARILMASPFIPNMEPHLRTHCCAVCYLR